MLEPFTSIVRRLRLRLSNDPRLARIVRAGISGLLGRGLGILVSAATLPLTVRYLGTLRYGIWVTISTTVVMLSVLDLGIANTLTNYISKAYAVEDRRMAQEYFSTAFWITMAISLTLIVPLGAFWHFLDWSALFHLQNAGLTSEVRLCVAISVGFFLLSLPLNLANRVLGGYQQVRIANLFAMMNSVLGLVAIVTVIASRGSLVQLTFTYCTAMLSGTVAMNVWLCGWHKQWLRPMPSRVCRHKASELFREGILFFVLQLAGLVVFNSDNLVIMHYVGASEVTPYSVGWRLAGYASTLQGMLVPALWPAFSEAHHRGDIAWIRNTYTRVMRASLLAVGGAGIAIGLVGRTVIQIWAGQAAVPGSILLWCMGLWALLVSITTNQASLLAATQRIRLQALTSSIAAAVNLALSIYLVQRMGALGVLLATILSYLVFIVAPQSWEVRNILTGRYMVGRVE